MRIGFSLCLLLAFLAVTGAARAGDAPVGDIAAGERVFRKCGACHMATGPENRVGPSLQGVVGRPVAHVESYGYSAAMKAFGSDGKTWDEARLGRYLLAPRAMVPGTRMSFAGLKTDKDIADVIAYLKSTAAQ
ncbi:cytochrome c family protein [Rhizobium sp. NFR03]|uniref:c-type cytochrome n=1 Tax=Rhizobium sp. NFR03 TaxID=1566263 RepID=UPI0008C9FA80|nr:cytochrome c family protein [Rhizobium sp. NFR03]SER61119.1 cytochrome c [Rhizobium sp. NFR03]